MRVTMVKKRLASGESCRKCAQAEDLLKSRGLWPRIDEVVWADENDPSSAGMQLGARFGVTNAPFFVLRDGDGSGPGSEKIFDSVLQLVQFLTAPPSESNPVAKEAAGDAGDAGSKSGGAAALSAADAEAAAEDLSSRQPIEILRWGLERWGASLGIAFSGAEDVVLLDMASESGLPFSVFCLDTGRLHPETYRFIDAVRKRYKVDISLMSPDPAPLQALVKQKGLFSFYDDGHEECCAIRKVEPLRRALRRLRAWATGQRRDQSPATRAAIAVVEVDRTFAGVAGAGTLAKLNPLARWSSAETWHYIRERSIPYNPLHERGFVSIGCEPCTRAVLPGEHERAGRWWWEETTKRECGLHIGNTPPP